MVFEKGVSLPVDADYEDPVTKRIAQRIQAAEDEKSAAIKDLIERFNLYIDVCEAVQVQGKKLEPQYCHTCNSRLLLYGVGNFYCPCWLKAKELRSEELPQKLPEEDGIFSYREICSRKGCSKLHDDLCCLCGKALCEEHMSDGCCGRTPAISDRAITEEFQLDGFNFDEANEEQAVQEVQYV